MNSSNLLRVVVAGMCGVALCTAQQRNYNPGTMSMDVNHIYLSMNRLMGDGGLQSQFSWNLTGDNRATTETFFWPADRWQSNMLYQIFNPLSLDDVGILDENSVVHPMMTRGE
jgi:hypothetical protein